MASAPRASLLAPLPLASCRGARGCYPAASGGAATRPGFTAEALPTPQLQIRSFSGWAEAQHSPGVGRLASPGGATAAAGPLSTSNYLRLRFAAPLPAAALAVQPEIWLFTYHHCHPAASGGHWHQPGSSPERSQGAGWIRATPHGAATQPAWAQLGPFTDIVLDANHWVAPHGHLGQVRRFRFALVASALAGHPTPWGKRIGPLSREVWLGANPRHTHKYTFQTPTHNPLYY